MAEIREIGIVRSSFKESADPYEMRKHESRITVFGPFEEGLYGIEENSHILVLFHFDRSVDYTLKGPRYHGEVKGVFASRSPRRPGNIGCTVVELLERKERELLVRGLDALDGTPVLDIKPYAPGLDEKQARAVDRERQVRSPRADFLPMLKNGDAEGLFLEAGRFHGEYCAGLALGVSAALFGIRKLAETAGLEISELAGTGVPEKLRVTSFIDGCFLDGLQYASGCTPGNGLLQVEGCGSSTDDSGPGTVAAFYLLNTVPAAKGEDYSGTSIWMILKETLEKILERDPFDLIVEDADKLFSAETDRTREQNYRFRTFL